MAEVRMTNATRQAEWRKRRAAEAERMRLALIEIEAYCCGYSDRLSRDVSAIARKGLDQSR